MKSNSWVFRWLAVVFCLLSFYETIRLISSGLESDVLKGKLSNSRAMADLLVRNHKLELDGLNRVISELREELESYQGRSGDTRLLNSCFDENYALTGKVQDLEHSHQARAGLLKNCFAENDALIKKVEGLKAELERAEARALPPFGEMSDAIAKSRIHAIELDQQIETIWAIKTLFAPEYMMYKSTTSGVGGTGLAFVSNKCRAFVEDVEETKRVQKWCE